MTRKSMKPVKAWAVCRGGSLLFGYPAGFAIYETKREADQSVAGFVDSGEYIVRVEIREVPR